MASAAGLDPLFHATAKYRRRDFDACIAICDTLLAQNAFDQAVWFLKCRALTEKAWIDDMGAAKPRCIRLSPSPRLSSTLASADMEEEGVGEVLLDDNATAQAPRPGEFAGRHRQEGVSLAAVRTRRRHVAVAPHDDSPGRRGWPRRRNAAHDTERPSRDGFCAPGHECASHDRRAISRPGLSGRAARHVAPHDRTGAPGAPRDGVDDGWHWRRPVHQRRAPRPQAICGKAGQCVLGEGSRGEDGAQHHLACPATLLSTPAVAKALIEYILYVDHNPRRGLELAAAATVAAGYLDWWWKVGAGGMPARPYYSPPHRVPPSFLSGRIATGAARQVLLPARAAARR